MNPVAPVISIFDWFKRFFFNGKKVRLVYAKKRLGVGSLFLVLSMGGLVEAQIARGKEGWRWERDRFAFANETVWNYEHEENPSRKDRKRVGYTRRCFVMARGALQFYKFARFDPCGEKLSDKALARRVREVARIPVWKKARTSEERVVFSGYGSLKKLSEERGEILRRHLGLGWPTYFRIANVWMPFPVTRGHQQRVADRLWDRLQKEKIGGVLWLIRFPSLAINHAVLVYAGEKMKDGYVFRVYDPNYADRSLELRFEASRRVFVFPKTFYFRGGEVTVRETYGSPWQ